MEFEAAEEATLAGRHLGDFVLREQIGRGGQGVVHRAEQLALGREAAVKVLWTEGKSKVSVMRFLREVKIAAQLDHPFAAHIYAFGAEPDLLWVAMEYVHGTPLDQMLREHGPIPLRRFLPFLERLCDVVHTAHEQGIVHRDIKPANVMVLSRAGRLLPKLLDLGIAKATSAADAGSDERPTEQGESATFELTRDALVDETTRVVTPPTTDASDAAIGSVDLHSLASSVAAPLTRIGAFVGSPPYMAPEAWRTPNEVDGRVDVYALGVLTYECLKGERPFQAALMSRLADLHVHATVPSLGLDLGPPFDHVLRRALAKRPDERYATAVDLSSALRTAAAQAGRGLPRVDEDLREAWLAYAPQPLAETLAVLDAARSEEQVWEALAMFKRAVLRYLGALALAAYTQSEHDRTHHAEFLATLAPLSQGAPSDADWAKMIRAACRAFLAEPERCPLPELVAFTRGSESLELLVPSGDEQRRGDDESENLPAAIRELEGVMRQLSFVAQHPLGIRRGTNLEALTGLRRTPRATLAVADLDQAAELAVVLVDDERRLRLQLSPLVTVRPAALGLPEEVFLLDGAGARGMKQRSFPTLFERQDEDARAWFDANLPLSAEGQAGVLEQHAPYLGLSTFRTEDAGSFFGREREVEGFVNRLRVQSLLVVVGPSGAGKSSFIQAGVVPALYDRFTAVTLRPGHAPLSTLVARLEREGVSGLSADGMRRDPTLLAQRLRLHAQMTGRPMLLIVDQLEELFTLCLDVEEREAYAATLVAVSEGAPSWARVVFTLRDDFLVRGEELGAFRSRLSAGLLLVTTPQRADLVRILTEPLKALRYAFEDEALIAEMVGAVQAQPGALALLSFTASQLWETRDKHFHRLTRRAYATLGGVGGALAQHAEATLTALDEREQALARQAFRHLVTSQGTRATLTRGELEQLLGSDVAASSMLEKLVSARLLVTQEAEGGADRVEIIHEALLSAWPRLMRWQREDAEGARLRDSLRAAARQWEDRRRAPGLLWRDEALAEYRVWRTRYPGALTVSEEAFAEASLREARRGQRIRRSLLAGAMMALALFSAFMWRAGRAERKAHFASEGLLRDSYLDQGRQLLLHGDPMQALVYLDQAQRHGARGAGFDVLVTMASLPLRAQVADFAPAGGGQVLAVDLSPDGRYAATGDANGFARVYDLQRRAPVWQHELPGWASNVAFVGEGELLVVSDAASLWRWASNEQLRAGPVIGRGFQSELARARNEVLYGNFAGQMASWNYATGQTVERLAAKTGGAEFVGYAPDGARAYSLHWAGRGCLWDMQHGRPIVALPDGMIRAAFNQDDDRLAMVSGDNGKLTVLDRAGRTVVTQPFTHKGGASGLAWSPDGHTLATGGEDDVVRTWDAATLEPKQALLGVSSGVLGLAYLEGGDVLAGWGRDGAVRLWDGRGDSEIGELVGHLAQVSSLVVSRDGELALTGGYDGTARLWRWRSAWRTRFLAVQTDDELESAIAAAQTDAILPPPSFGDLSRRGDLAGTYDAQRNLWITRLDDGAHCRVGDDGTHRVREADFTPDDRYVLTAELGSARIGMWQTSDCSHVRDLSGHTADVRTVRVSHDGRYLASGSMDQTARLWDIATGALVRTFAGNGAPVVRVDVSPDGEILFSSAATGQHAFPMATKTAAWAIHDGTLLWRRAAKPNERFNAASYAASRGRRIVIDGNRLELVEERSGRVLHALTLPQNFSSLGVSPDAKWLVAIMRGQNALVIDGETLTVRGELDANSAHTVAFSADSKLAILTVASKVLLFELESRHLLARSSGADIAVTAGDRDRVLLIPEGVGRPRLWSFGADPKMVAGLRELVRCRVPFEVEAGSVTKRNLPSDCPDDLTTGR